jgi:hypothetical protein
MIEAYERRLGRLDPAEYVWAAREAPAAVDAELALA